MPEPLFARCGLTLLTAFVVLAESIASAGTRPGSSTPPRADQPAAIWASGPLEVVAAFEKPIEPQRAKALVGQSIPYFELAGPEKDARQQDRQVGALRIVGVQVADAGRTLMIATDPHPRMARYVLPTAALVANADSNAPRESGSGYDLSGVEWGWSPQAADPGEDPRSTGWWPSLDLETTKRATRGSLPHEACLALLAQPGRLVLSALVRLPEGAATVRLESTGSIEEATLGENQGEPPGQTGPDDLRRVEFSVKSKSKDEPLFLMFRVRTGQDARPFQLKASYRMASDKTGNPLEKHQVILPWAPLPPAAATAAPLLLPDLSGGDAARGQALFMGEQARCSQCHTYRGQGGKAGPDLTEISKKGRAELYRSIAAPSASIEPDYTSYTVATKDGQVVVGLVRAEGPSAIRVTDTNARSTLIPRGQIQQIRPSGTSIMPVGLAAMLGDAAVRDIIAFLTTAAPGKAASENR